MVRTPAGPGLAAQGLPWKQVRVESISETKAQVIDKYGVHLSVSTLYRRGGGPFPREDETWIIDRTLGFWTFAAKVVAHPPVVSGSTGGIPALNDLLAELAGAELIIDASTDDSESTYNVGWLGAGVQYRKVAGGLVLLRGAGSGGLVTLPPGYRPSVSMTFAAISATELTVDSTADSGGFSHTNTVKPLHALATYAVTVSTSGAVSTTAPVSVRVDGITFLAEP